MMYNFLIYYLGNIWCFNWIIIF